MNQTVVKSGIAAIALIIGIFVGYCWPRVDVPQLQDGKPEEAPVGKLVELGQKIHAAEALHKAEQGCDAAKAWKEVVDAVAELPQKAELKRWQTLAEKSKGLADQWCNEKKDDLVERLKIDPKPKEDRPGLVPEHRLAKLLPKGRKTRSISIIEVKGRATFEDWGFLGTRDFIYVYELEMEMEIENREKDDIQCLLHIVEVRQNLALADEGLELALPDDNVLVNLLLEQAGRKLEGPALRTARVAWKGVNLADPKLKKTLTKLLEFIRFLRPGAGKQMDVISQLGRYTGLKVRLDYKNGLGATNIEVLDGPRGNVFDKELLRHLANGVNPLMDEFIFPGADKKVGAEWEINAKDVVNILPFWLEFKVTDGNLKLKREPDVAGDAKLSVVNGFVAVKERKNKNAKEGKVEFLPAKDGEVSHLIFSGADQLVNSARLRLNATSLIRSEDHLIFQARKEANLQARALYRARTIPKEAR